MRRVPYSAAVYWVAHNDNAGAGDSRATIAGYLTTGLVADLWNISAEQVAQDVATERENRGLKVGAD